MNIKFKFAHGVAKEVGHYVYALYVGRSKTPFYVGKGSGNRVFNHINKSLKLTKDEIEDDLKFDIISSGKPITHKIIRHGLDNKTAYRIEASIIDMLGIGYLSNKVRGQDSFHGIMTIDEINTLYRSPEVPKITEKVILININKQFDVAKNNKKKLYEATRKSWILGKRRDKAEYAFTVANGIVYEIIEINKKSWNCTETITLPKKGGGIFTKKRWEFRGKIVVDPSLNNKYLGKSVKSYWKSGGQNPIRYSY